MLYVFYCNTWIESKEKIEEKEKSIHEQVNINNVRTKLSNKYLDGIYIVLQKIIFFFSSYAHEVNPRDHFLGNLLLSLLRQELLNKHLKWAPPFNGIEKNGDKTK